MNIEVGIEMLILVTLLKKRLIGPTALELGFEEVYSALLAEPELIVLPVGFPPNEHRVESMDLATCPGVSA